MNQAQQSIYFEGMTSISAIINADPSNGRRIVEVLVDKSKKKSKASELAFLQAKAAELGFSITYVEAEQIDSIAGGSTHGGILARTTERLIPPLTLESIRPGGFYVYTEGIEDPYNFGYTVRALYAAGVDGVVLPERNWMSAAGVVARASAGCSERLPLFTASAEKVAALFHAAGYNILCAGIRDSVSLFDEEFRFPILLVIGGEKRGISRKLLDAADKIVRVEYGRPFRGSLSAASAASVMAFELLRQNRK